MFGSHYQTSYFYTLIILHYQGRFIMRKMIATAIILLVVSLTFTNCAALFNSGGGVVSFSSNPSAAEVIIDGQSLGKTPVTLDLDRTTTHQVIIKKDGVEKSYILQNKVGAGWIVLDLLGGLIPVVIDAATGSWYTLSPKTVNAQF
jgi:hypothetical protein